jgi:hypothetical protein
MLIVTSAVRTTNPENPKLELMGSSRVFYFFIQMEKRDEVGV